MFIPPEWFPRAQMFLAHLNISSDHHCSKGQARAGQTKKHCWCDSSILFSSLNNCLLNPLLPFTTSMPQEWISQLPEHIGFPYASESLPMPFFLCSLKTFYAFFKTQHKCISVKHSPGPPGKAACSHFLLMGREFYMPILIHLNSILLNIGGICLYYWPGNDLSKA